MPKIAYFRCSPTDMFGDTLAAAPAIRGLTMVEVDITEVGKLPLHYLMNHKPKG
jgi:acetolactate synthase I/II/III large subunit